MKAIVQNRYGGPEELHVENVAKPTPGPGEVLIEIKASSITRADQMMLSGKPYIGRLILGITKPKHPITGTGFAGVVIETGSDCTQYKVGDEVFGESIEIFGAHAEYIALPEEGVFTHKPQNVSFEEAATVCDGIVTSINLLKNVSGIEAGQNVLINGASGALGTAAVQLARLYGARVTGVCSTKNVEFVRSMGAHDVIDYTKQYFTDATDKYDIIYDTVGTHTFQQCKQALKPGGRYSSPVLGGKLLVDMLLTAVGSGKKAKFSATGALPAKTIKEMVLEARKFMAKGLLESHIERTYSLDDIHSAHSYIAGGHKRGNVVFKMNQF